MLSGPDLLQFVQANPELSQRQLAKAAGYIRANTKSGREQILEKQFYQALLKAKGVDLKPGQPMGKCARYETTVHRSGVVLVGKTYVQRFGLQPGDELEIQLEDDAIRLVPKLVKDTATPSVAPALATAA